MNCKLIYFFIIFFCFSNFNLKSQTANDYFNLRSITEKEIVVLSNENQIIPLKNLDKKQILVLNFGTQDFSVFNQVLSRYTKIEIKNITNNEELKTIKFKNFNLIIIATNISNLDSINKISNYIKNNKILCYFANPLQEFNKSFVSKFESVILCFDKNIINQDITAQIIFGGISASGKLETTINEDFKKDFGLKTDGEVRFKYTIPAELNIDSLYVTKKIDSIINNGIKNYAFPGCQIVAAKDGKIFFYKSYGYQTYDSLQLVSNTDLYDLASVTKISAPLPCLMKLYEQGDFKLNEKLSTYWKSFENSNKKDILVIDALTHQAQLKAWIPFWKSLLDSTGNYKKNTIKSDSSKKYCIKISENEYLNKKYYKTIFQQIADSPLESEKKYLYSDLSFYLYPTIIEQITKQNYENYLYTNFYNKLGANSLKYNPLLYYSKSEIAPTELDILFRNEQIQGRVHDEGAILMGGVSGHAGLFGNANDLAKLMQMYLNYGTYGGERFLNDTTLKKFTDYQFKELGNRRAIGFDKPLLTNKQNGTASPDASDLSFGHTGFTGTFVWADPQNGLLLVFTTNRIYPSRNNKNIMSLNIRTSIHHVLYDCLK